MNEPKASIYLADLTHTTVTISNDSFPLNIGYINAYLLKYYKNLKINLFKYPEKLKAELDTAIPDIVGFSNYPWNLNLNISFMKWIKKRSPSTITVMGGPNISYIPKDQESFLTSLDGILDFYCLYEGEKSFKSLFDVIAENEFDLSTIKGGEIPGVIFLKDKCSKTESRLHQYIPISRSSSLEEFPSPYQSGLLDEFFDDKLSPMIETHRGCPFTCSFCHEGHDSYKKVNRFDLQRVLKDLEYISEHVGDKVSNMMIADPNFGMYESDVTVGEYLAEINAKTGFPKAVFASTAKNSKERLIRISKITKNISMPLWLSVQSMTDDVLKNINRRNISIEQMIDVSKEIHKNDIKSYTEVIMCLPGETYQSHFETILSMVEQRFGSIMTYQLMLVEGSALFMNKKTHEEFGFVTKFRAVPRSFSDIEDVGKSIEVEQIVVATKDMSFTEYLKARKLHLVITTFYNRNAFKGFMKLVDEFKIDIREYISKLFDVFSANATFKKILADFIQETKDELFDNKDAVIDYYTQDANYRKLLNGEAGSNLLQNYSSLFFMKFSCELIDVLNATLSSFNLNEKASEKLEEVTRFYKNSLNSFLSPNRINEIIHDNFVYDISNWIKSDLPIKDFKKKNLRLSFYTSKEQYEQLNNYQIRFGKTEQSFGKILTRMWITDMMRKSEIIKD